MKSIVAEILKKLYFKKQVNLIPKTRNEKETTL